MLIINPTYYQAVSQQQTPNNARKVIENYSYALSDQIGKGFSSIVYKGRNDESGETVAIKVIDKKGLKTPLHYQLLRSEVEALSQLNSPHIMRLYKVYYTENNTYLITEFCDGGDLSALLSKQGQQKEATLQKHFIQIVQGYKAMKQRGIVHRDLKPANILLKQGLTKIADFGFATTPNSAPLMPNVNVGSPLYMSPQAFKNRYSEKSDIWALGVSLFELLFGQVPWQANSEKELAHRMATVPVNFPGNCTNECRDFILRCLIVDEGQRICVEEMERHPWLAKGNDLQMIKGKGFHTMFKKECTTQSPLSEAVNKGQNNSSNSSNCNNGKENQTAQKLKQEQQHNAPYLVKSQNRTKQKESQVNQSFEEVNIYAQRNAPFQSQRQHLMSMQMEMTQDTIKKNDYVILSQINFTRYLYRVAALIDKNDFFQSGMLREKLLFLVNKNIMIKITNLKDLIEGHNTLNLIHFNQYMKSNSFHKLGSAVNQYHQKYMLQFNTVWLSLNDQREILTSDKKFDAVFDDNYTEYESFYIILNSILRTAVREIQFTLEDSMDCLDSSQLLPLNTEGGVILLDYLITYFQLASLIQECFDDQYTFAVDSKIEQIADGKPVRLTYGHYLEIRNKIKQLDI